MKSTIPTTIWYITALDTVDNLHYSDVQCIHRSLQDAQDYALNVRKCALRIYECKCINIINAEIRREHKANIPRPVMIDRSNPIANAEEYKFQNQSPIDGRLCPYCVGEGRTRNPSDLSSYPCKICNGSGLIE